MALTFGRRRTSTGASPVDAHVAHALQQAENDRFTGSIEVDEKAHHGHAWLYFFEGGLYSISLTSYEPRPLARLVAAGVLTAEQADALQLHPHPEAAAVEQGLVSLDAVATVHQEVLLASAGAVLAAHTGHLRREKDATTDRMCTLPLRPADVLDAVAMRRERMEGTWPLVSRTRTPGQATLRRTAASAPLPSALPELTALLAACDGQTSVDEVAFRLGFTRAEVVHLAGSLVASGHVVEVEDLEVPLPLRILVPEAFGEISVHDEGGAGALAAPAREGLSAHSAASVGTEDPRIAAVEAELAEAMLSQRRIAERIADLTSRLQELRDGSPGGAGPQ